MRPDVRRPLILPALFMYFSEFSKSLFREIHFLHTKKHQLREHRLIGQFHFHGGVSCHVIMNVDPAGNDCGDGCMRLHATSETRNTHCGARTHDHKVKSLALCRHSATENCTQSLHMPILKIGDWLIPICGTYGDAKHGGGVI